jgi:hypothetical protein
MKRRFPTSKRFGLLGAFLWSASATAVLAAPPSPTWRAVAASGPVEAHRSAFRPEVWTRLSRGDELAPLDLLRTGRRGRATLVQGATVLMIDPMSHVELPVPGDGTPAGRIVQKTGSVFYEVDGRTHGGLQVITPYLVAGVKGTSFVVTIREGSASVSVEEGIVAVVSPKGDRLDVGPGETAIVDAMADEIIRRGRGEEPGADRVESNSRDAARVARQEERRLDRMSAAKREPMESAVEPTLEVLREGSATGVGSTDAVEKDFLRTIEEATKEEEKQRELEETTIDTNRKISVDLVSPAPAP